MGYGWDAAHLGVRAPHEIARVVHEVGPDLYEEVSDQRARRLRPPRLTAARRRQGGSHQEGHRRRGQCLGSRGGDPRGDASLFGFGRRLRIGDRIVVRSLRRDSRGPALRHGVLSTVVKTTWQRNRNTSCSAETTIVSSRAFTGFALRDATR